MRRFAKWAGITVGVLVVVALCVAWWLWREVTALPQWYEQDAQAYEGDADTKGPPQWIALDERGDPILEDPFAELDMQEAEATLEAVPAPTESKRRGRQARAHEMRGFHRSRRKKKAGDKAIKASRAHFRDGELEVGAVVDLSRIPKDKLSEKDRAMYDRAVRNFPGLTKRDVYVGVEDHPITRDGYLQLGPHPTVRVGNLRYPLAKAAGKLGLSESRLRRDVDRELRRMGLVDPESPPPSTRQRPSAP